MNETQAELCADFKLAMRRLATTVSILTCQADAEPAGMAVTSVSSLSAEPPAVLVCVNRATRMHPILGLGTAICLNLLADHQQGLCDVFGGRVPSSERFTIGEWQRAADFEAPYLVDAQANLFCRVDALFDYGTHSIVVGKVAMIRLHGEVRPLIFGNGGFMRVGEPT